MRVAILHYHLRPGGVATVIRNAQHALAGHCDTRVLADFGYNEQPARDARTFLRDAEALRHSLTQTLKHCSVLHTHNLNLGKHPRLTCAVKLLAEQGRLRVIHQVHDFAEENRPAQLRAWRYCTGRRNDAFWRSICYYDRPNVLWATLTARDAALLARRGVPADKIHVLPNPVDDDFLTRPPPSARALDAALGRIETFAARHGYQFDRKRTRLLSPMKVMERKNNAEAVALLERLNARRRGRYQLLISLDASSARDRAYSDRLKRRIRRARLPVVIGFGGELDLSTQFHLADAILTTSKVEGFGYAFVEGWLCGKPVLGRDIPEVTQDFAAAGMDLRHLYREFDEDAVRRVDRLLAHPPQALIARNRRVVLAQYSLRAYARRFLELAVQSKNL
jgi:glycosyltransferase involved in cell wall biosynthesis